MASTTASVSARLERLPMTPIHHMVFLALSFAYFFELGDPNTFAHAAPAIIKAWGIDVGTVALITSASCGGMFLGAVFGGVIADRLGRKRALIYGGFSLVNAAAWDISSLAAARFVTGIGLSAMTAVANTYITGFFPAARRGRFMGLVMTIGLVADSRHRLGIALCRPARRLGLAPDFPVGRTRNPGADLRRPRAFRAALVQCRHLGLRHGLRHSVRHQREPDHDHGPRLDDRHRPAGGDGQQLHLRVGTVSDRVARTRQRHHLRNRPAGQCRRPVSDCRRLRAVGAIRRSLSSWPDATSPAAPSMRLVRRQPAGRSKPSARR